MDRMGSESPSKRADAAAREKRLHEATLCGGVESLHELMLEDKLTLARVSLTCFNETPLHIAVMLGHVDFVKALLSYNSDLVTKLDYHGRAPIHLASGAGRVEVVKLLLAANGDVCLVRDEDGKTPLHLAVMHGQLDIVNELIRARPQVVSTRFVLERGETILHTCVLHNRLEVLKVLVSVATDDDFVNFKDENGYTILHIAASLKHKEIVKYLISGENRVRVNIKNRNGLTALDMVDEMPRDLKTMEIIDLLVKAGGRRSKSEINPQAQVEDVTIEEEEEERKEIAVIVEPPNEQNGINFTKKYRKNTNHETKNKWVEEMRGAIMVAATVIASMAYQAALNPPGGVWQEPKQFKMSGAAFQNANVTILPGSSVLATYHPNRYITFWAFNTISFATAIGVMFLLVSGIPFRRRLSMWILMLLMWLTITSMTYTYIISIGATTPYSKSDEPSSLDYVDVERWNSMNKIIVNSLCGWLGLIGLVIVVHFCRFIWWIITQVRRCLATKNASL